MENLWFLNSWSTVVFFHGTFLTILWFLYLSELDLYLSVLSQHSCNFFTCLYFPNTLLISIPVCTRSPICSLDMVTEFPLSSLTVATEGKHFLLDGGGGARVVVGTQNIRKSYCTTFISTMGWENIFQLKPLKITPSCVTTNLK